jgi:hypothetical protein
MRFPVQKRKLTFKYGSLKEQPLTSLDIAKWYEKLGGKTESVVEVDSSSYFPGKPYPKTALKENMPPEYLCMGSLWVNLYKPNNQTDTLAISVYRDLRGHIPVDHYNLFLQYEVDGVKKHTDKIPNRHIPLGDGVIMRFLVDDDVIDEATVEYDVTY